MWLCENRLKGEKSSLPVAVGVSKTRVLKSIILAVTELTRVDEPMCLHGQTLARLGGLTLPSKKGDIDPARQVTLLAAPTFQLSCKRFAVFYKEMKETLARPE